jgi:hypothetical protein
MADEHIPPGTPGDGELDDAAAHGDGVSANGATSDGHRPSERPAVRSGLAQRRNPALVALGEFAQGVRRVALRDPVATFLLLASIGLAVTFGLLLGSIKPSSAGTEVPLSTVQTLARSKQVANATLLDHDSRVVVETTASAPAIAADGSIVGAAEKTAAASTSKGGATSNEGASSASKAGATGGEGATSGHSGSTGSDFATAAKEAASGKTNTASKEVTGNTANELEKSATTSTSVPPAATPPGAQQLWAAYPASGAQTQQLARELFADGAIVNVDQQANKGTRTIIVQFLIPILLLVCLFSLFMRIGTEGAAGGIAGFSQFTGKGRKKGKGTADKITFADVAGAGEAVAELREIRDYLADPSKYLAVGAAAPMGVMLGGAEGAG